MKKIPLTQGEFAVIDDEDFRKVNQFKWSFDRGYARAYVKGSGKRNQKAF